MEILVRKVASYFFKQFLNNFFELFMSGLMKNGDCDSSVQKLQKIVSKEISDAVFLTESKLGYQIWPPK